VTDAERLEWACGVLNKHKHLESSEWFVATLGFKWFAANLDGDEKLLAFEAIVIKRNGNNVPGIIGPPPLAKAVTRGISIVGAIRITPSPSRNTTPSFMKVER
jgi:hypothetical protein